MSNIENCGKIVSHNTFCYILQITIFSIYKPFNIYLISLSLHGATFLWSYLYNYLLHFILYIKTSFIKYVFKCMNNAFCAS